MTSVADGTRERKPEPKSVLVIMAADLFLGIVFALIVLGGLACVGGLGFLAVSAIDYAMGGDFFDRAPLLFAGTVCLIMGTACCIPLFPICGEIHRWYLSAKDRAERGVW